MVTWAMIRIWVHWIPTMALGVLLADLLADLHTRLGDVYGWDAPFVAHTGLAFIPFIPMHRVLLSQEGEEH